MRAAITTRAERQGDHYVLNGVKQFITSRQERRRGGRLRRDRQGGRQERHQRVRRADHDAGLHRRAHRGEDRPARLATPRRSCSRIAGSRGESARRGRRRLSHRARQPRVGPHQRRRAGDRRGARGARGRARLCHASAAAWASADRAPGGQLPPRGHGDAASRPRASSTCTPRGCATPASRASRKRRWRSCSPPRWPSASAPTRSRSTAATATSPTSRSSASGATCA